MTATANPPPIEHDCLTRVEEMVSGGRESGPCDDCGRYPDTSRKEVLGRFKQRDGSARWFCGTCMFRRLGI